MKYLCENYLDFVQEGLESQPGNMHYLLESIRKQVRPQCFMVCPFEFLQTYLTHPLRLQIGISDCFVGFK